MHLPGTPGFIAENSTFVENVLEHRFIYDVSRRLLLDQHLLVNMMRSEVDAFGFDFVLSAESPNGANKRPVYVQMKTRSNALSGTKYAIAESLGKLENAFVVWMLYNSDDFEPISYYCYDCSDPNKPFNEFPASKRRFRKAIKMQEATHKELTIEQLVAVLFPTFTLA